MSSLMDKQLKKFLEELESEEVEVFKIIRVEKKAENDNLQFKMALVNRLQYLKIDQTNI